MASITPEGADRMVARSPLKAARRRDLLRQRKDYASVRQIDRALRESGRCGRCGRRLTDQDSINRGLGPDCWEIVRGHRLASQ